MSDFAAMVGEVTSRLGPVDVLVNNAAIADGDDVLEIEEPTWDRDVSVVLKSVFLCSKAVLPSMIERRAGVIVNIASVNGLSALGNEAYSAAKAGMINLTQGIAVRYGGAAGGGGAPPRATARRARRAGRGRAAPPRCARLLTNLEMGSSLRHPRLRTDRLGRRPSGLRPGPHPTITVH